MLVDLKVLKSQAREPTSIYARIEKQRTDMAAHGNFATD